MSAESRSKIDVKFESHDKTLVGNLFLPQNYAAGQKLPGRACDRRMDDR